MKFILICAALLGAVSSMPPAAWAEAPASAATQSVPYRKAEVLALSEKVADYQIATLAAGLVPPKAASDTPDPKGWIQGALFVGMAALADHSDKPIYRDLILARGAANQWQPGARTYHADDYAITQSYLWAARHGAGSEALAPTRARFDDILSHPPTADLTFADQPGAPSCQTRWCWCDALFMAPASWMEMSRQTGDPRYAAFAKSELWATTKFLYDPTEHLFFRDSRFFERRDPNGRKLFWSRGNGWVFAGLTRMIDALPESDQDRAKIISLYKEMAVKLKAIQKPDGYWSPSLLADPATTLPESSGTGFYVYGFAWGIKAGLLDRNDYAPVVRKGWAALVKAVHPDGKLGWVQPVSDRPDSVGYDDTQYYGVGAFLLAGTAVADLDLDSKTVAHKPKK